jgi:hypothetical protein
MAQTTVVTDGPYWENDQSAVENLPESAPSDAGQVDQSGRIYFLSLQSSENEPQLTLNEISVIEGGAPDYRSGGDWYFQLIDEQQRVLEEGHFQNTGLICSDSVGPNGQWTGSCSPGDTPLTLEIPYNPMGTDITVYDNTGTVRFGPYDVRGM